MTLISAECVCSWSLHAHITGCAGSGCYFLRDSTVRACPSRHAPISWMLRSPHTAARQFSQRMCATQRCDILFQSDVPSLKSRNFNRSSGAHRDLSARCMHLTTPGIRRPSYGQAAQGEEEPPANGAADPTKFSGKKGKAAAKKGTEKTQWDILRSSGIPEAELPNFRYSSRHPGSTERFTCGWPPFMAILNLIAPTDVYISLDWAPS